MEDLLITPINKPGYALEVAGDMTVVIDTNLNDDLIKEGIARELTSKIQTMRKEAGFEVVDHIVIGYACDQEIADILTGDTSIADGVLCDGFSGDLDGYVKDWDINGHKATLSVKKA